MKPLRVTAAHLEEHALAVCRTEKRRAREYSTGAGRRATKNKMSRRKFFKLPHLLLIYIIPHSGGLIPRRRPPKHQWWECAHRSYKSRCDGRQPGKVDPIKKQKGKILRREMWGLGPDKPRVTTKARRFRASSALKCHPAYLGPAKIVHNDLLAILRNLHKRGKLHEKLRIDGVCAIEARLGNRGRRAAAAQQQLAS